MLLLTRRSPSVLVQSIKLLLSQLRQLLVATGLLAQMVRHSLQLPLLLNLMFSYLAQHSSLLMVPQIKIRTSLRIRQKLRILVRLLLPLQSSSDKTETLNHDWSPGFPEGPFLIDYISQIDQSGVYLIPMRLSG